MIRACTWVIVGSALLGGVASAQPDPAPDNTWGDPDQEPQPVPTQLPSAPQPYPTAQPYPVAQPQPQPIPRQVQTEPPAQSAAAKPTSVPAKPYYGENDQFVYTDVTYAFEWSHWATPSGHAGVLMSGFEFTESRGVFTNLILAGLAGSGSRVKCTEENSNGCTKAVVIGASEQEKAAARAIAGKRPFGLTLRGYHESLGSDVDGFEAQLTYITPKDGVASVIGLAYGNMSSNRRSSPLMAPEPGVPNPTDNSFSREWIGAVLEARGNTSTTRSVRTGFVIGYWDSWIIRFEFEINKRFGPFHLGAGLVTDSYKPSRAGGRATLGVTF